MPAAKSEREGGRQAGKKTLVGVGVGGKQRSAVGGHFFQAWGGESWPGQESWARSQNCLRRLSANLGSVWRRKNGDNRHGEHHVTAWGSPNGVAPFPHSQTVPRGQGQPPPRKGISMNSGIFPAGMRDGHSPPSKQRLSHPSQDQHILRARNPNRASPS